MVRFWHSSCTAKTRKHSTKYPFPAVRHGTFLPQILYRKNVKTMYVMSLFRRHGVFFPLSAPNYFSPKSCTNASRDHRTACGGARSRCAVPWSVLARGHQPLRGRFPLGSSFPPNQPSGCNKTNQRSACCPAKKVHQPCGQCTFFAYFPVMLLPYES